MTKSQYLTELEKRLGALGREERAELLADYEAHFESGRAAGKTDEEIARRLGPPQLVAREILYQLSVDRARSEPTLRRIAGAVFAGIGLGVMQVMVLLVPFLCGLLVLAGLFAASVYLVASPVLFLLQDGGAAGFLWMLPLLAGLVGVGLILWVAAVKGSSLLGKWMLGILQTNVESIRRKLA